MIDRFKLLYNSGANKNSLALNRNLTTEQIDLLYQTQGVDRGSLSRFSKLTDIQFMRLFNDEDFNKNDLSQNPNLTPEQIDLLYFAGANRNSLASYSKLTDEQFMRFFNDEFVNNNYLAQNPSINAPANQPFASGIFNWKW